MRFVRLAQKNQIRTQQGVKRVYESKGQVPLTVGAERQTWLDYWHSKSWPNQNKYGLYLFTKYGDVRKQILTIIIYLFKTNINRNIIGNRPKHHTLLLETLTENIILDKLCLTRTEGRRLWFVAFSVNINKILYKSDRNYFK